MRMAFVRPFDVTVGSWSFTNERPATFELILSAKEFESYWRFNLIQLFKLQTRCATARCIQTSSEFLAPFHWIINETGKLYRKL